MHVTPDLITVIKNALKEKHTFIAKSGAPNSDGEPTYYQEETTEAARQLIEALEQDLHFATHVVPDFITDIGKGLQLLSEVHPSVLSAGTAKRTLWLQGQNLIEFAKRIPPPAPTNLDFMRCTKINVVNQRCKLDVGHADDCDFS